MTDYVSTERKRGKLVIVCDREVFESATLLFNNPSRIPEHTDKQVKL